MHLKTIAIIIAVLFGIASYSTFKHVSGNPSEIYSCKVLDKIKNEPAYKRSAEYILVLKVENYTFSRNVNPAVWSQAPIGGSIQLKLRPIDVHPTDEMIFWLLMARFSLVAFFVIGGVLVVLWFTDWQYYYDKF